MSRRTPARVRSHRRTRILPALAALTLVGILPATASAAVDVAVTFQPDAAPVAPGYAKDIGLPFDDARGAGFVRADSLASATHVPLDVTLNTRARNAVADLRQDSFIHLEYPASSSVPGVRTPAAWELAVPSGFYTVTVGVGDATAINSIHRIDAEGRPLLAAFTPTSGTRFRIATKVVQVTDGRLTLDSTGGTNTKLDFVTVTDAEAPPADTTPPAAPTGVPATAGPGSVALSWAANPEDDVAEYRVFRGTGATVDTSGTPLSPALKAPAFTDSTATGGTTYRYVVEARDFAGNRSAASASVTATPATPAVDDLAVNFQAQSTVTPDGYAGDYGRAYDATRGYGWLDKDTRNPLSLVGNGRERRVNADKRLDTFVSMQLKAGSAGVTTPGAWRAAVANGTYLVTVAAGDPSFVDSHHVVNVEGETAIDFRPTTRMPLQANAITVAVTDGTLDVDAIGGDNTKLDYVRIERVDPVAPTAVAVTPSLGARDVCRDGSITVQLSNGVDPTTATSAGVQLLAPDGTQVAGFYSTDGAHANVTLVPAADLAANALYTVKVTTRLKTSGGVAYAPATSTFTTAPRACRTGAGVSFTSGTFDFSDGTDATSTAYSTAAPTALALGPDPVSPTQLWVGTRTGAVLVYRLDPDTGLPDGQPTRVDAFAQRTISGLRFDPASTAGAIKLWVSNGASGCDLAAVGLACDDFTGAVSTLTGTTAATVQKADVVTGLPRSVGSRMNNGIDVGPDGALYLAQDANSGFGAPDAIWGNRSEDPLSAAILRLDVRTIGAAPYDVDTSKGYDPAAAGAKVTAYATGTGNASGVLWHSNGRLYAPLNGSSSGDTPADPAGGAPELKDLPAADDAFTQIVARRYYGHPNPARGEYRLAGANPTAGVDPFEVPQYPEGTSPNANWRQPDLDLGAHRSIQGSDEFRSNVFGAKLRGQVLLTEYSGGKDLIAVKLDAAGKAVSQTTVAAGFNNPLPVITDDATGRVYVGEFGADADGAGGKITLLTPAPTAPSSVHVDFGTATSAVTGDDAGDYGQRYEALRGFGWESNATGEPLSLVGNGRERKLLADKRLDTFVQMQANSGVKTPGRWEADLADGIYDVTVGVGDASFADSRHVINAEGVNVVDFTPAGADRTKVATATVTVSDGRLTLTPTGGTNTKLAFVDVIPHVDRIGTLAVTAPEDVLGLGGRMVFSTVADQARDGHELTVTNTGDGNVVVTDITIGGADAADFALCADQPTAGVLAPGDTVTVCVAYRPTAGAAASGAKVSRATLTIASNATNTLPAVTLGGLDSKAYGPAGEPDLQQILDALGYKVAAGVTGKPSALAVAPGAPVAGDEVPAPYWRALDPAKPVSLVPVARYGDKLTTDSQSFGWYEKGSTTDQFLYALRGGTENDGYGQNQLLLPGTTTGTQTFTPAGSFGLVDGLGWRSDDALNAGGWHNMRFLTAKDASGATIPGTYLVAEDVDGPVNKSSKNWDYQDAVFVLVNAVPDITAPQPASGEVAKALASFPGTAGGIANTGFSGALGTVTASKLAFVSGRLRVTTSADTDVVQTNALTLGAFAGTGFQVQSRLIGPFTAINAGTERQGIFWGADARNHLRVGVEYGRSLFRRDLTVTRVVNGVATVVSTTALPGNDATTLDLRIAVQPSPAADADPFATVSYTVGGATAFTTLGAAQVTFPKAWITANTPAGIITSSAGGSAFSALYASFGIARTF